MSFSTLITPRELNENLGKPDWVVFDCRHTLGEPEAGEREYRENHLPGAIFAHVDRDLSGATSGETGRHPLPEAADFVRWLGEHGVSPASQVVAYDDSGGVLSARIWWMMTSLGHTNVAVLNGGLTRWKAEGLPVNAEVPTASPAEYAGSFDMTCYVWLEEVLRIYRDPDVRVVDARSPERYSGSEEPYDPVAGHIPGSINIPYRDNLDGDGNFKPIGELRRHYSKLGRMRNSRQTIHYCGSGVTSCHNMLAMAVAGLPPGRLYVGSWSQWCSNPGRPVGTGENP